MKRNVQYQCVKAGPHCLQCCVLHVERNIVESNFVERDIVEGNIVERDFVERNFVERNFVATSSTLATLYLNCSTKSPKVEHVQLLSTCRKE